jgi:hypothetical protein
LKSLGWAWRRAGVKNVRNVLPMMPIVSLGFI